MHMVRDYHSYFIENRQLNLEMLNVIELTQSMLMIIEMSSNLMHVLN